MTGPTSTVASLVMAVGLAFLGFVGACDVSQDSAASGVSPKASRLLAGLKHPLTSVAETNCGFYEYVAKTKRDHAVVAWADYSLLLEDFPSLSNLVPDRQEQPSGSNPEQWRRYFMALEPWAIG